MQPNYIIELPNDLCSIAEPVEYLIEKAAGAGFDADRLRLNFRVGLTEALANAMLYGNCRDPRKRVRIEAAIRADEIRVRVTDEGHGFDPEKLADPTEPGNRRRDGGRGIFLIRRMMDYVEFNDKGNSITMVLLNSATVEPGAGT
jgi:serine/threonine-protein kinase RsbW